MVSVVAHRGRKKKVNTHTHIKNTFLLVLSACLGLWVAGYLTSALILTKENCLKSLLLQIIVSYLHYTVRTKWEFFSHHCPLFSVFSSSHSQHFLCGVNPDSPGCKWFDFFCMCLLQSEVAVGAEKETTGGSELLSRGEVSRTCLLHQVKPRE